MGALFPAGASSQRHANAKNITIPTKQTLKLLSLILQELRKHSKKETRTEVTP